MAIKRDPATGWFDCPLCDESYDTEAEAEACRRWCADFEQECADLMTGDPDSIEEI